jgi:hypothetical protein
MQQDRLERVAAPIFNMYRHVIEKRPNLIIPEANIRTINVRKGQRELAQVREQVDQIERDLVVWRMKTFKPFGYSNNSVEPKDSFSARAWSCARCSRD